MRVYPHLQDTGGFFIAIIQRSKRKTRRDDNSGGKKRTAPLEPMNDGAEQSAASEEPELKRTKIEEESLDATAEQLPVIDEESKDTLLEVERSFKENPYTFVHPDEPGLASCLSVSFPIKYVLSIDVFLLERSYVSRLISLAKTYT